MVDVVTRRLTGVVDEDDAVEIIARPEETHDGERSRHNKVVANYFRSVLILRRKKLHANNSTGRKKKLTEYILRIIIN
jgi:hypothetical protein